MSVEISPFSKDFNFKKQTVTSEVKSSPKFPAAKKEQVFVNDKPPVKGDIFTRFPTLQSSENSSIFKRTMSEADIIASQDISPEGEVARLSHKDKIFRAMHGGSKPEVKLDDEEFFDLGDLVKDESDKQQHHEKDPEALAKKLGEALGVELVPFGSADKGKEHIILEDKTNKELYKIDKFSPPAEERKDKAMAYNLMRALSHGRLPESRSLEAVDETGTIVKKMEVHPQFEEARAAVKKGDPTVWNEITGSYFSDVLDEWKEMGFDYWNDPSLDADERDNYITVAAKDEKKQPEQNKNIPGNQVFVDDFWETTRKQYALKDVIRSYVLQHPEKYPPEEVADIMAALRDVEEHVESQNQPKAADKSISRRELTHA